MTLARHALILTAISLALSLSGGFPTAAVASDVSNFAGGGPQNGAVEKLPASRLLTLTGDGYELGRQQGVALRPEILALQEQWLRPKLQLVPFLLEFYAKQKVHAMAPFIPQAYKDEIRGMTDAVGIDFDTGLIVNAIPDVMELMAKPFGCSTFVALPSRSDDGGLIYGRNLDYGDSNVLRAYWHPTVFARTGKHRILSINVPGMSGVLTAINDQGVMMSRMTSYNRDIRSAGMPSMLLFRQILEDASSAAEAARLYEQATRTVAVNVMIADRNTAVVGEATARQYAERHPSEFGTLYAANHFETPSLQDGRHGRDARWPALARLDATGNAITAADVRETLARAETPGHNILAVVVDYAKRTLIFGADPEHDSTAARGKMYEIDLSAALPGF